MGGITWLHLSDWHQKGAEFDRTEVRNALLKDIRERSQISPDLKRVWSKVVGRIKRRSPAKS